MIGQSKILHNLGVRVRGGGDCSSDSEELLCEQIVRSHSPREDQASQHLWVIVVGGERHNWSSPGIPWLWLTWSWHWFRVIYLLYLMHSVTVVITWNNIGQNFHSLQIILLPWFLLICLRCPNYILEEKNVFVTLWIEFYLIFSPGRKVQLKYLTV